MFFPRLARRPPEYYHSRLNRNYADYRKNYTKISEDCQFRCVYCDTLLSEIGYEGFQLDHFRPQAYFPQLTTDPLNLVLSCPKCNVLKSDDWPALKAINQPSYIGTAGYIDNFLENPSDFFSVEKNGIITPLKGPAKYILERLNINRASRKRIRRQRQIDFTKTLINKKITELLRELSQKMNDKEVDYDTATLMLGKICEIKLEFDSL